MFALTCFALDPWKGVEGIAVSFVEVANGAVEGVEGDWGLRFCSPSKVTCVDGLFLIGEGVVVGNGTDDCWSEGKDETRGRSWIGGVAGLVVIAPAVVTLVAAFLGGIVRGVLDTTDADDAGSGGLECTTQTSCDASTFDRLGKGRCKTARMVYLIFACGL
jgi:hypothetical protein